MTRNRGMRIVRWSGWPCPLLATAALLLASVPVQGSAPPGDVHGPQAVATDTALLAVVVQTIARGEQHGIRVDPRPLRPDPGIGPFVRQEHFADVGDAAVEARAAALARIGIATFRKSSMDNCGSGPGGTPPAIEPGDTTTLREWLSQPLLPTCVLVGLPRPGGAHYPPAGIDRRDPDCEPDLQAVRVVTMGTGQAIDVFDFVVRADAPGKWRVLEVVRLSALRS